MKLCDICGSNEIYCEHGDVAFCEKHSVVYCDCDKALHSSTLFTEIRKILETGWSIQTTYPECRQEYPDRPKSFGQCYATARVLNHVFGWGIMKCESYYSARHFWNRLPNGREIDFALDQFSEADGKFGKPPLTGKPVKRKYKTMIPRIKRLLKAVEEPLRKLQV